MTRVYVAAGSNVEPQRHIELAVAQLRHEFPGARFSPWYRNRAAGFQGDDFINLVAELDTAVAAKSLKLRLQCIEELCGRQQGAPRWAPRSMDLDILLYGDLVSDDPQLRLPRPDLLRRAYMLGPLADLAPTLIHPTEGKSIGELWDRFDRQSHPLVPICGV